MDKKTKKLIVVIIVVVISIVCAILGVSLGVPIETLIPIGTEIIDGLSASDTPAELDVESFSTQTPITIYATI